MDDTEKKAIKELIYLKNHLLTFINSDKRVPRIRLGYVRLLGKVWPTRELIGVLLEDAFDRRVTASFEMARSLPQMEISRKAAKILGLTIYRTGRPCFKGHDSWRYVSSGACVACRGLLTLSSGHYEPK